MVLLQTTMPRLDTRHRDRPATSFDPNTGLLVREGNERPSAPELIDVKVTERCGAGCSFCYMSAVTAGRDCDADWLQTQLLSLAEMPFQVAFGGGEPTWWPGLLPMAQWLHDRSVVCNMSVGPSVRLGALEQLGRKELLGALGVTCVPGTDYLAMLALCRCLGPWQVYAQVVVATQFRPEWQDQMGAIAAQCDRIVLLTGKPVGRAASLGLQVTSQDMQDLVEVAMEVSGSVGVDLCAAPVLCHYALPWVLGRCDAGLYSMFLDGPRKCATPCSFLTGPVFSLAATAPDCRSLGETWATMQPVTGCAYELRGEAA